jgi:hypothetical protein
MNTITLVAKDRPEYLIECLSHLVKAILEDEHDFFDRIIICLEPGNDAVLAICQSVGELLADGLMNVEIYQNLAFDEYQSDFNLHLEDDACVAPDALRVLRYFKEHFEGPVSRYTLFSMCNHRAFGKQEGIPLDPSMMAESRLITSPFAWAMSKHQWPFVKDSWNKKQEPPNGWDFSLSFALCTAGRRTLHPFLSRCKNIGRLNGVHETYESFDKTQVGLEHSDGTYRGLYRVAARLPDSELFKIEDWMRTELYASWAKALGQDKVLVRKFFEERSEQDAARLLRAKRDTDAVSAMDQEIRMMDRSCDHGVLMNVTQKVYVHDIAKDSNLIKEVHESVIPCPRCGASSRTHMELGICECGWRHMKLSEGETK